MVIMRAVYGIVIVETVGVGQSETDIASVADSVLFCVQPGSGDSLQYMKAGIAEIPDITAVTKADLGAIARQTRRDLASALTTTGGATGLAASDGWQVPVLEIAAADQASVAALLDAVDRHRHHLAGDRLIDRRRRQAERWIELGILEAYGREGLKVAKSLPGGAGLGPGQSPFQRLHQIQLALAGRLS
jgi:LAO/AO transport system kinase